MFIAVTPSFIVSLSKYPTPQGTFGHLFCKLIGSQFFVYALAKVSVFTVTCLALERWYSVIKPTRYKSNFTRGRVYGYIALIWLFSLAFNSHIPFGMKHDELSGRCIWITTSYRKEIVVTTYTIVTFILPTSVTWTAFLCIAVELRDTFNIPKTKLGRAKARLLRTCVLVALLMTLCWFPNQLYYTLTTFGVIKLETPFHHFTIVLAMSNNIVNPWIYCISNKAYRNGFYHIFINTFKSISHRQTFKVPGDSLKMESTCKSNPRLRYLNNIGSLDDITCPRITESQNVISQLEGVLQLEFPVSPKQPRFIGQENKLGYVKDSNDAAHSVDSDK